MSPISLVKVKFNDGRIDYLYYSNDTALEKIKNSASKYEDGVYIFTESKNNFLKSIGFDLDE